MNDDQFREFLKELREMNRTLQEIRDRLPEPLHYSLMEK
jgi:hypothetical protein